MTNPNEDYYAWTQETIEKLRQGRLNEVNAADLIEEIEDMAGRERRELNNRLKVLLTHLLKWQYQPEYRSRSWQSTLIDQREMLQDLLDESPSLRPLVQERGDKAYHRAVRAASRETGLAPKSFPATFEGTGWKWEQVLDPEFFPN